MAVELKLKNWHKPAIVDSEFIRDMAIAHNENWYACFYKDGRRVRQITTRTKLATNKLGEYPIINLAQVALAKYGKMIDHKDGDPFKNLASNLRLCNYSQNNSNRAFKNSVGFRGVTKSRGRYKAQISLNNRRIFLGRFNTKEEAAHAYDAAAKKYHGEFAILNFPEQSMEAPTRHQETSAGPENSLSVSL